MSEVPTRVRDLHRFLPILGPHEVEGARRLAESCRARLGARTVWNVNSTATGGGVAEMLPSLLGYARGAGLDARWMVIEGNPDFFRLTKRLHHALHGSAGDGMPLDDTARAIFEDTARQNAPRLTTAVRPGDVVILHDPQPAGLAPLLIARGALVIWRCHIGHDVTHPEVAAGWAFLEPYLRDVPAFVFTREAYVPGYCAPARTSIITPSIDAFSAKNQELDEAAVHAILIKAGLIAGGSVNGDARFTREDGRVDAVADAAEVVGTGTLPDWTTPIVTQISRWDPLKDPVGVLRGFVGLLQADAAGDAHLLLAGPDVSAVTDDPEGGRVFAEVVAAWRALPPRIQARVHIASLPMADVEANAAMVNALQRHATVVVQKSLQEGFGLTVTEAMWKARPVIASSVGGIQDQIDDGVHGLLVRNPTDLDAFAAALGRLLRQPDLAATLGENARTRVRERFLGLHHLMKYASLIERLDAAPSASTALRPSAALA